MSIIIGPMKNIRAESAKLCNNGKRLRSPYLHQDIKYAGKSEKAFPLIGNPS
jgi:hypothetical protein